MPEELRSLQGDTPFLRWAIGGRPRRDEAVSGDRAVVLTRGVQTVLAAIDGLGHGAEAAEAAQRVAETINDHPAGPLDELLHRIHRELAGSRGAAATVAIVDGEAGTMQWVGVGNVDGVLLRADGDARPRSHGVFLAGGVLGHQLGPIHVPDPLRLSDGDIVALATDGVQADLAEALHVGQPVELQAATIIAKHARSEDDSLVLVACYTALDRSQGP